MSDWTGSQIYLGLEFGNNPTIFQKIEEIVLPWYFFEFTETKLRMPKFQGVHFHVAYYRQKSQKGTGEGYQHNATEAQVYM